MKRWEGDWAFHLYTTTDGCGPVKQVGGASSPLGSEPITDFLLQGPHPPYFKYTPINPPPRSHLTHPDSKLSRTRVLRGVRQLEEYGQTNRKEHKRVMARENTRPFCVMEPERAPTRDRCRGLLFDCPTPRIRRCSRGVTPFRSSARPESFAGSFGISRTYLGRSLSFHSFVRIS